MPRSETTCTSLGAVCDLWVVDTCAELVDTWEQLCCELRLTATCVRLGII